MQVVSIQSISFDHHERRVIHCLKEGFYLTCNVKFKSKIVKFKSRLFAFTCLFICTTMDDITGRLGGQLLPKFKDNIRLVAPRENI